MSTRNAVPTAVCSATVFAIGAACALGGAVGSLERRVFRRVNDLPNAVEGPLWIVMQAGTLGAVVVAVVACLGAGRRTAAVHGAIAGVGAWALAKILKTAIGRGRPGDLLPDVVIRGGHVAGFGFPSGHSAVAAALAGSLSPFVSRPLRWALWAAAFTTAFARLYVGAHLPLDVVGGLALGWFLASAVNLSRPHHQRAP